MLTADWIALDWMHGHFLACTLLLRYGHANSHQIASTPSFDRGDVDVSIDWKAIQISSQCIKSVYIADGKGFENLTAPFHENMGWLDKEVAGPEVPHWDKPAFVRPAEASTRSSLQPSMHRVWIVAFAGPVSRYYVTFLSNHGEAEPMFAAISEISGPWELEGRKGDDRSTIRGTNPGSLFDNHSSG